MSNRNKVLVYLALTISSIVVSFPIVWMLAKSFHKNVHIFDSPPTFIPSPPVVEPYLKVFTTPTYLRFFFNSYFLALTVSLVSLLIGTLAGYAASRFEFSLNKPLNLFIIATQTIPPITLLIPYYAIIVNIGLYNTYPALIITYASFGIPYSFLMMRGYIDSIPKSIDEAVLIDGGSRFDALSRVILPLARPGMVATAIFTFLLSWNEYLFALTLTKTDAMRTIPVGISLLKGQQAYQWNTILSMAVIGSVPILILFALFQKQFISGLTLGSIKA